MDPTIPDVEAIRAATAGFYRAFEAGDGEAMADLWATSVSVSCIHPGWQPAVGREAVIASWLSIFEGTTTISFTLRNSQIFVAGDAAWGLLLEEIDAVQEGGQRVRAVLQATNIFIRENGAWRLTHHHASPALGAALPPSDPRRLFH